MINAREDVQTNLSNSTAVTAFCPVGNIHIIRAPRDNKSFPRICIIKSDNAPASISDDTERASRIRIDLWMWAETQAEMFGLVEAVNAAMKSSGWARIGTGPDGYVIGPEVYEKMLSFEGVFTNNE